MTMSTSASERWTPFRKLEKHFKNRAVKGQLPSLRKYPIIDLSRPTLAEDDPLWKAGWWSPINDLEIDTCHARRNNKGKARDLGERPSEAAQQYGLRTLTLSTGETGYLISEGQFTESFCEAMHWLMRQDVYSYLDISTNNNN